MRKQCIIALSLVLLLSAAGPVSGQRPWKGSNEREGFQNIQVGPRPFFLVQDMEAEPLEERAVELLRRPGQENGILHWSSRGGPDVSRTYQRVLRSGRTHGSRHSGVRCDLHQ